MKKQTNTNKGYTLLEMAIVLSIVAIVAGTSISASVTQFEIAKYGNTRSTLKTIQQALELYHKETGRYPCPSYFNLPNSSDIENRGKTAGEEEDSCRDASQLSTICAAAGLDGTKLFCEEEVVVGAVPFKTLGITDDVSLDAWGNKVTYAVDRDHTIESGTKQGGISILGEDNIEITRSETMGKAIYVLVSHGENGNGAYSALGRSTGTGNATRACEADSTFSEERTNCSFNDGDVFRDRRISQASATGNKYFDDIVIWKAQTALDPVSEQNSAEGQLLQTRLSFNENKNLYTQRISGGDTLMCVLAQDVTGATTDERIYCRGDDSEGQVGNANGPEDVFDNFEHVSTTIASDWKMVSAQEEHACGITKYGNAYCWGKDSSEALGNGWGNNSEALPQTEVFKNPVKAAFSNSENWVWDFINTSGNAGGSGIDEHTCAIALHETDTHTDTNQRKGRLFCWGRNSYKKLGIANNSGNHGQGVPWEVQSDGTKFTAGDTFDDWHTMVATASAHTCAIRGVGESRIYCWGKTEKGRLGNASAPHNSEHNDILEVKDMRGTIANEADDISFNDWLTVTAEHDHTCGLRTNGSIYCWGKGWQGRLGNGDDASSNTPVKVKYFSDWSYVQAGAEFTCAIRRGQAYCWGRNHHHQLTNGTTAESNVPVLVAGGFTDWQQIGTGTKHACGLRATGQIYCWGKKYVGSGNLQTPSLFNIPTTP